MRKLLDKSIIRTLDEENIAKEIYDSYCVLPNMLLRSKFSVEDFKIINKFINEREEDIEFKSISNNEATINGVYVYIAVSKKPRKFEIRIDKEKYYVDRELICNILGFNVEMHTNKALINIYREREHIPRLSKFKGNSHIVMMIDTRESLENATLRNILLNTKLNNTYTIQYAKEDFYMNCKEFDFNLKEGKLYYVFREGNFVEVDGENELYEYLAGDDSKVNSVGLIDKIYENILEMKPTKEELGYIFSISEKDAQRILDGDVGVDIFKLQNDIGRMCSNKYYIKYKFSNLDRKDLFLKLLNQN